MECVVCGADNLKQLCCIKMEKYMSISFSYEEVIGKCDECGESEHMKETDKNYLEAFEFAKPRIVKMLIGHLAIQKLSRPYIERVLGIRQRTIEKWLVEGCSDGELVLLKIIHLHPELLIELDEIPKGE